MNKCIIQFWEESGRIWGIRHDGCSLHIDSNELGLYLNSIYSNRQDDVPDEYERILGKEKSCFISDELFEKLCIDKNIRLFENEKNNLINMGEIIFKPYEDI